MSELDDDADEIRVQHRAIECHTDVVQDGVIIRKPAVSHQHYVAVLGQGCLRTRALGTACRLKQTYTVLTHSVPYAVPYYGHFSTVRAVIRYGTAVVRGITVVKKMHTIEAVPYCRTRLLSHTVLPDRAVLTLSTVE